MSFAAILGMVSLTLVASAAVWLRRKYYRIYNGLD